MLKMKLPLKPSTKKQVELQSMREGGKNQMWGKECFRKGVIIVGLKQQLWIGNMLQPH